MPAPPSLLLSSSVSCSCLFGPLKPRGGPEFWRVTLLVYPYSLCVCVCLCLQWGGLDKACVLLDPQVCSNTLLCAFVVVCLFLILDDLNGPVFLPSPSPATESPWITRLERIAKKTDQNWTKGCTAAVKWRKGEVALQWRGINDELKGADIQLFLTARDPRTNWAEVLSCVAVVRCRPTSFLKPPGSFWAEFQVRSQQNKGAGASAWPLVKPPLVYKTRREQEDALLRAHIQLRGSSPHPRLMHPAQPHKICVGYVKCRVRSMGELPGEQRCHHTLNSTPGLTKHPLINNKWGLWLNIGPHQPPPPGPPPPAGSRFCKRGAVEEATLHRRWLQHHGEGYSKNCCVCVCVCVRADSWPGVLSAWPPL